MHTKNRTLFAFVLAGAACIFSATSLGAEPFGYSVASFNNHLYRINLSTGVATDIGAIAFFDAQGLAFAEGRLYAIGGFADAFWDITTPPGLRIGPALFRVSGAAGLDYDRVTGTMYNIQGYALGSQLYRIDLSTSLATFVGQSPIFADNLAIDANGRAFAADTVFTNALYEVDLKTGALTLVGSLGITGRFLAGASFDDAGTFWLLREDGAIFSVDTTSGQASFISQVFGAGAFRGLAIPNAIIPEPGSASLLLFGAVALVGWWKLRTRVWVTRVPLQEKPQ